MSFVTRKTLLESTKGKIYEAINKAAYSKASAKKTVFLSHSHNDKELIENVKVLLQLEGVDVYIDINDKSLPNIPGPATARLIKKRIEASDKLVVIASDRAADSKWIPWELGLADAFMDATNVAIFPVLDDPDSWHKSEYINIYQTIQKPIGSYRLINPDGSNGEYLSIWLNFR